MAAHELDTYTRVAAGVLGPSVQASVFTAQHQGGEDEPQSEEQPDTGGELPCAIAHDRTPESEAKEAASDHQECPPVAVERISSLRGPGLSHDSALPHSGTGPILLGFGGHRGMAPALRTTFAERRAGTTQ